MMAFSAMLEGPSEQTLLPMITSAFPKIILLLKDQNKEVQIQTSITISRIAEFHSLSIFNHFEANAEILIQALSLP